jgi:hypothetical protein
MSRHVAIEDGTGKRLEGAVSNPLRDAYQRHGTARWAYKTGNGVWDLLTYADAQRRQKLGDENVVKVLVMDASITDKAIRARVKGPGHVKTTDVRWTLEVFGGVKLRCVPSSEGCSHAVFFVIEMREPGKGSPWTPLPATNGRDPHALLVAAVKQDSVKKLTNLAL